MQKTKLLASLSLLMSLTVLAMPTLAIELSISDFDFNGSLGSDGATIQRLDTNKFKINVAAAPGHPEWKNMCQFQISDHAQGNSLQIQFADYDTWAGSGGNEVSGMRRFGSWSYDMKEWHPVIPTNVDGKATLVFPEFTEDKVYFGGEVPMAYETMLSLVGDWAKHPDVTVHNIGTSAEGRSIYRVTITDNHSPYAAEIRWGHHFVNQHCYEYNAQWRMAGMIDWLLSEEADAYRQKNICHFVIQMNADGAHNGFGRVNSEGIDMNRSYSVSGWENNPTTESKIVQRDLEQVVASDTPITTTWSMHTWGGDQTDSMVRPGPEMGTTRGPWTELRDVLEENDTNNQFNLLYNVTSALTPETWTSGTHKQFGVTAFCVEGAGNLYTQDEVLHTGEVLMKSICQFYGDPLVPPPAGTNAYANEVMASNPLVYFRMNEASGQTAGTTLQNDGTLGTSLNATWGISENADSTPASGLQGPNGATRINGCPLLGLKADNKAARFTAMADGTADWLELGQLENLDLECVTYAFWFNAGASEAWSRLITCDPDFDHDFQLVYDSDKFYLVTHSTAVSGKHNVAESPEIGANDGAWHHAVVVRNGDDARGCRLYIDGQNINLNSREGSFSNGTSTRIGTREASLSAWGGLLDELAIWNRALEPVEVMTLFNAAMAKPGDANGDGVVDGSDVTILAGNWQAGSVGIASATWEMGDFNGDGKVDGSDVTILAGNWQYGTTTANIVPEQSSSVLLLTTLLVLTVRFNFQKISKKPCTQQRVTTTLP